MVQKSRNLFCLLKKVSNCIFYQTQLFVGGHRLSKFGVFGN